MLRFILPLLLVTSALAQTADPKPLVEKALTAAGGKDKLLKIFRIKEIFHFGSTPEPAEGKKRSTRESILSQPDKWWINKKERGTEPAKDDVRAWSLDLLVDEKSKIEVIPDLTDEGKTYFGLKVSGSITPAMDFYFDTETVLLKRLDWRDDISATASSDTKSASSMTPRCTMIWFETHVLPPVWISSPQPFCTSSNQCQNVQ